MCERDKIHVLNFLDPSSWSRTVRNSTVSVYTLGLGLPAAFLFAEKIGKFLH